MATNKVKPATDRLAPRGLLFFYGLPAIGVGYMFLFMSLFLMKFATDILLIAPAVMGAILGASRVWDAVSDPIVGYLSDRTRSRAGRRRPWLYASAPLIGLSFLMVFAPAGGLTAAQMPLWMGVAIFAFFTAMTIFVVPHLSLGADLTLPGHPRNRVYGARHLAWNIGSILALAAMAWLLLAPGEGDGAMRRGAALIALLSGAAVTLLIWISSWYLQRYPVIQASKGSRRALAAYRDVWRNSHARLLLIIIFVDNMGLAIISVLTLYVSEYVVGRADLAPLFILSFMIPAVVTVPFWVRLAGRFGKKPVWLLSMILAGLSFGGMFFADEGRLPLLILLAALAGAANGNGGAIGPSLLSDTVDFDAARTGERKEGAYFAAMTFMIKLAFGVTFLLTGLVLQWVDFIPNQPQTETVKLALRSLYGLYPLFCYGVGALLFLSYRLREDALTQERHMAA